MMRTTIGEAWAEHRERPRHPHHTADDHERRAFYAGFAAAMQFFRELSEGTMPLPEAVSVLNRLERSAEEMLV